MSRHKKNGGRGEMMIHEPPAKSPDTQDQFQHEQTTENQPGNPQTLADIIPYRPGVALIALIQVDNDISEDAKEIERDKPQDGEVLGSRGEEFLYFLPAYIVHLLVACGSLF